MTSYQPEPDETLLVVENPSALVEAVLNILALAGAIAIMATLALAAVGARHLAVERDEPPTSAQ